MAAAGRDHAAGLELAVGAGDGPARDAEVVGELADRRQPVARPERAGEHERGDLLAQLLGRRARRRRIDRERHADAARATRHVPSVIPPYASSDPTKQTAPTA